MTESWTFNSVDEELLEELCDFLPPKLFDFHAHLYRHKDLGDSVSPFITQGPPEVTREVWHQHLSKQVGSSRLEGGLFIPFPSAGGDIDAANEFILEQTAHCASSRGLLMLSPETDEAKLARLADNPQVAGFKCYNVFSSEEPTFNASIRSFLPPWVWSLADERELVILLHLVKWGALRDEENQVEIRQMCESYPGARLILCHAARGFNAYNTVEGIGSLRGLENVWFDTSGICEPGALVAILQQFGPHRLMWGSDFPVSELRGRCVTIGDGFAWLQPDNISWQDYVTSCRPALVGLESLRALRDAGDYFGLSEEDFEGIFYGNAVSLLGLDEKPGNVTQSVYQEARRRIPGGTQLLSKRPEKMAPGQWPAYFREARGCETWDLDGRHYYDMSTNGIGSCLLGFRDPDVTQAVKRRVNLGSMSTLNPPEEVLLADMLCEIHPWAQQVRFARTGGEAMALAVRIARATTDRSVVAICGYHGWHDWYLAANLGEPDALRGHLMPMAGLDPLGVPRELQGTTLAFHYEDTEEFEQVMQKAGDRLAAVVMEPCRHHDPQPGFLAMVRDRTHECGAVLVYDEITIGWRLHFGGAHLRLGVQPDIAVFAKALGNGHPIAAIIGTEAAMDGAHESFISSTYWTESVGPVAALATLRKMQQIDVPAHVARVGRRVQDCWQSKVRKYGVPAIVGEGYPCLAHFHFDHELREELRTLYTQLMLRQGFLDHCLFYPTLAHTDAILARYEQAAEVAFEQVADALDKGSVEERLDGPVAETGFQRLMGD